MTIAEAKALAKISQLMIDGDFDAAAKKMKSFVNSAKAEDQKKAAMSFVSELGMINHPLFK